MYSLKALEAGNPKSRCGQGPAPLRLGVVESLLLHLASGSGPASSSLSLHLHGHLHVASSPPLFLPPRTQSCWLRAHPNDLTPTASRLPRLHVQLRSRSLIFLWGGGTIPRHWWDELGPWASDSFGDHLLLSISRRFPSRAPHLRGACEVTRKSLARLPGSRSATSHPPPPAPFLGHPPPTIHTSWAPGPASSHQVRCRGDLVPWGSSHTLGTDAN